MKICGKIVALVLISIVFAANVFAESVDSSFDAANRAYSVGEYDKAITIYEDILGQEGMSSSLLYNLGNSYAQSGRVGMAVLSYERALKLSPSDSDVLGNLSKVRKDSGLFVEEPENLERFMAIFSIDGWTWLSFFTLVGMVILLTIRLKYNLSQRFNFFSWAAALITLMLSVSAATYSSQNFNPLVVVAKDVKLQLSPFDGANSSGSVQEGRLLHTIKTHADYIYITDKSGRKGWVKEGSVALVCATK